MEKYYLRKHFVTFWNNFDKLISNDQIKSPEEVFIEIKRKDDNLYRWMEKNKARIYAKATSYSSKKVSEMVIRFRSMCKPNALKTKADPYVIACALDIRDGDQVKMYPVSPVVVTEESPGEKNNEQKIPDACNFYKMEWISVPIIIQENNWFF
jgi:hypothetical protein